MKKRAQAAMEFLMTYGWAILVVLIVVAALYAFDVFQIPAHHQCAAEAPFVSCDILSFQGSQDEIIYTFVTAWPQDLVQGTPTITEVIIGGTLVCQGNVPLKSSGMPVQFSCMQSQTKGASTGTLRVQYRSLGITRYAEFAIGGDAEKAVQVEVDISTAQNQAENLQVAEGSTKTFTLDGREVHTLKVEIINQDEISIVISSTPVQLTMKVGETKQVDVNGDGINDMEVHFLGIISGVAQITTRNLNPIPSLSTNQTTTTTTTLSPTTTSTTILPTFNVTTTIASTTTTTTTIPASGCCQGQIDTEVSLGAGAYGVEVAKRYNEALNDGSYYMDIGQSPYPVHTKTGQNFIPKKSGYLYRLDIYIERDAALIGGNLPIEIRQGGYDGPLLARTLLPLNKVPISPYPKKVNATTIFFDDPPFLTAGSKYAILITNDASWTLSGGSFRGLVTWGGGPDESIPGEAWSYISSQGYTPYYSWEKAFTTYVSDMKCNVCSTTTTIPLATTTTLPSTTTTIPPSTTSSTTTLITTTTTTTTIPLTTTTLPSTCCQSSLDLAVYDTVTQTDVPSQEGYAFAIEVYVLYNPTTGTYYKDTGEPKTENPVIKAIGQDFFPTRSGYLHKVDLYISRYPRSSWRLTDGPVRVQLKNAQGVLIAETNISAKTIPISPETNVKVNPTTAFFKPQPYLVAGNKYSLSVRNSIDWIINGVNTRGVVIWDASPDKIPGVSWYDGSHSGVAPTDSLDQEFKLYLSNTPCTTSC